MTIKFELDSTINSAGTSKRGTVTASYNDIVNKLGEPTKAGNSSPFNEWAIQFTIPADDGDFDYVEAFIYDWNEKHNPKARPNEVTTFMIGGKDMDAAYYVHQIMAQ